MQFQTLQWVIDINGDGTFSLWELWETARWAFRIPGSLVVEFIGQFPALASILNISASPQTGYASLSGLIAKTLSLLFWVPLLLWTLGRGAPAADKTGPSAETSDPLLITLSDDYPIKYR
ncbi:hypothetical protein L1889_09815 [Paenalcaligenes niemegkensis]|uniref:hypothetical protein n=1 Tax=Paenalcaligenes niemegkensis TaxID=2895469 RepID=UPI001EE88A7B|nr:hypothetical protein [Paenalcaligenes niemegkensis]MCQ9616958.1 hypothetical protein [Paenalcaligenes niemegkensis]